MSGRLMSGRLMSTAAEAEEKDCKAVQGDDEGHRRESCSWAPDWQILHACSWLVRHHGAYDEDNPKHSIVIELKKEKQRQARAARAAGL